MKIVTIVWARPQFIKAAPLSKATRDEAGWNVVAGVDASAIIEGYQQAINSPPTKRPNLYGDGKAAQHILQRLIN